MRDRLEITKNRLEYDVDVILAFRKELSGKWWRRLSIMMVMLHARHDVRGLKRQKLRKRIESKYRMQLRYLSRMYRSKLFVSGRIGYYVHRSAYLRAARFATSKNTVVEPDGSFQRYCGE